MKFGYLSIDPNDFDYAASAIHNQIAEDQGLDIPASDIASSLIAYVTLGSSKVIGDYSTTLSSSDQQQIVDAIRKKVDAISPDNLKYVLIDLDRFGSSGIVNQLIAYPRKWEAQAENAVAQSQGDTAAKHPGGVLGDTFQNIGDWISKFLSGLGLSVTTLVIILVVAVLAYLLISGKLRGAQ